MECDTAELRKEGAHGSEDSQKEGTRAISSCQACQSHLQIQVSRVRSIEVPIHNEYGKTCSRLPRLYRTSRALSGLQQHCVH